MHAVDVDDDYDENDEAVDVDDDDDNDGELPQPWSHGGDCGCLQLLSSFGTFPATFYSSSRLSSWGWQR